MLLSQALSYSEALRRAPLLPARRGPAPPDVGPPPACPASSASRCAPWFQRAWKMAAAAGRLLRASVSGCWLGTGAETLWWLRTCVPGKIPFPSGLAHFRPRRVSASKGAGGLILYGRFPAAAQNCLSGPHIAVPSPSPSLVLALEAGYLSQVPVLLTDCDLGKGLRLPNPISLCSP